MPESEYVNMQTAAEELGITRRRIWQMVKAGELEAIQSPLDRREKLIPRQEIDRLKRFISR